MFIMPNMMTTRELAEYLRLHEITVCKYVAAGRIPAVRIGKVWRFDQERIHAWIAKGTKEKSEKSTSGR